MSWFNIIGNNWYWFSAGLMVIAVIVVILALTLLGMEEDEDL